jgi:hypothetical protein
MLFIQRFAAQESITANQGKIFIFSPPRIELPQPIPEKSEREAS